jgi:hypothetical protein
MVCEILFSNLYLDLIEFEINYNYNYNLIFKSGLTLLVIGTCHGLLTDGVLM